MGADLKTCNCGESIDEATGLCPKCDSAANVRTLLDAQHESLLNNPNRSSVFRGLGDYEFKKNQTANDNSSIVSEKKKTPSHNALNADNSDLPSQSYPAAQTHLADKKAPIVPSAKPRLRKPRRFRNVWRTNPLAMFAIIASMALTFFTVTDPGGIASKAIEGAFGNINTVRPQWSSKANLVGRDTVIAAVETSKLTANRKGYAERNNYPHVKSACFHYPAKYKYAACTSNGSHSFLATDREYTFRPLLIEITNSQLLFCVEGDAWVVRRVSGDIVASLKITDGLVTEYLFEWATVPTKVTYGLTKAQIKSVAKTSKDHSR